VMDEKRLIRETLIGVFRRQYKEDRHLESDLHNGPENDLTNSSIDGVYIVTGRIVWIIGNKFGSVPEALQMRLEKRDIQKSSSDTILQSRAYSLLL